MKKIKNNKKATFSQQIKKEIISNEYNEHCLTALLSSFIQNKLIIVNNNGKQKWKICHQFKFIIDFIGKSIKKLLDCKIEKEKNNNILISKNLNKIENSLHINDDQKCKILKMECCKKAYIAGAFLACGSINSLDAKYYHLELHCNNYQYLIFLQNLLINFKIYPVLIKHPNKHFILYLKKAEQISDFLKLINSINAMLSFEDHKIIKDFNTNVTRLSNLDFSNINRTIQSSKRQVNQIKKIINLPIYNKQSFKFKCFCQLRLRYPTYTLKKLSNLLFTTYKIKISKSGLNHFTRKLEALTNK